MQIKNLTFEELTKEDADNNFRNEIFYVKDVDASMLTHYDIPLRLEAASFIFCKQGSIRFYLNAQQFEIKTDDLFIYIPKNILRTVESSPDMRCDTLIASLEFMKNTNLTTPNMPVYLYLRDTPILSLTEEEKENFNILSQINSLIHDNEQNAGIMRRLLFGIFAYKLQNIILSRIPESATHSVAMHNRQNELLHKFMELLAQYHKEQRSITFYANELFVTPKYFSTVIKKVSGRSPVDWINDSVIREAKAMLRFSTMSVQEIAYALNFSSQTFFGKYFKRLTGITPGEFRLRSAE